LGKRVAIENPELSIIHQKWGNGFKAIASMVSE
jgi:hypothetical protein